MIDDADPLTNFIVFVRNEPAAFDEHLAMAQLLTKEQREQVRKIASQLDWNARIAEFRQRWQENPGRAG